MSRNQAVPGRKALLYGAIGLTAFTGASCALHTGFLDPGYHRPPELTAEWIDLKHTTEGDTALWVLRGDGYDGSAHIVATTSGAHDPPKRTDRRYGTWYFDGSMSDSANRAICFARRIGREGATCLAFRLDTVRDDQQGTRRLTIRGYPGEHTVGDRQLIERQR
jgi:hypothetical protein